MTTKIDAFSPAVAAPSHDEAEAPPPAPPRSELTESNQLSTWSVPGVDDAVANIESSYGWGVMPDMQAIDTQLGKLEGFALLKTLNNLEADDKLESILNRMTPNERQQVINQAVKGNLLGRDRDDKLRAKYAMPPSFQKMVDELNTLASREKRTTALTYNWSAYQEDAHDVAKRKFADQISTLKPGDSIELDAKIGGSANHVTGSAESKVEVKRGADGSFTIGAKIAAELGPELKEERTGAQLETLLGAGGRVEYKFGTAEEAKAAAELFATSPPEAIEKFGKPSAIELEGKVAAEAAESLGLLPKVKGGEQASLALRVELDKKEPEIALRVEAKLQGELLQSTKAGPLNVQVRGIEAGASGKVEVEVRTRLRDPDEFLAAPVDYVKRQAPSLLADAKAKVVISSSSSAGHHTTVNEVKLTTSTAEAQRLLWKMEPSMSSWELLSKASEGVQIEVREKKLGIHHYGADLKLDLGSHTDFSIGAGYERKSVESDRPIYKGSAKNFVTGKR